MKYLITTLYLIGFSFCYAQTPFYTSQLNGKETILEILPLDTGGFYLRTGCESMGKISDQKLLKFNQNNQLEFEKPIADVNSGNRNSYTVSSPFCENTFIVAETRRTTTSPNMASITTIKKDGTISNQSIETNRHTPKDIITSFKTKMEWPIDNPTYEDNVCKIACFAGTENLYLLAGHIVLNGKSKDTKPAKTLLYEYNPNTGKLNLFVIPISFTGKYLRRDCYVEFLGNDEEHIYVAYKNQEPSNNTTYAIICQLNYKGEIIKEYPVSFTTKNLQAHAAGTRQLNGAYKYPIEYYASSVSSLQPLGAGNAPEVLWNNELMNGLLLDIPNKVVYFYGLSVTQSVSNKKNSVNTALLGTKSAFADHIYVCKTDLLTNKTISTIEYPFMAKLDSVGNKELSKMAKDIVTQASYSTRVMNLNILSSDMVRLSLFSQLYGQTLSFLIDIEQSKVEITGKELPQYTESLRSHCVDLLSHQWEQNSESWSFLNDNTTQKKNKLLCFKSELQTVTFKIDTEKTLSIFSFPSQINKARIID